MKLKFNEVITTEEEFRKIMGIPSELVTRKTIDFIDDNCKSFIKQSPFIVVASSDLKGNFDISPKGDPSEFVKILDNKTLAMPDRLGNRRTDTFMNILQNPKVGLIFLIPGIKETLRISGTAQIIRDIEIRELLAHKNRLPNLVMIVHVQEVFMHCAKCIIRSKLWNSNNESDPNKVPTLAKSMVDHGKLEKSYEEMNEIIKNDENTRLY